MTGPGPWPEPPRRDNDGSEVSLPGEERYDLGRAAWNLTVDQRPAAVWPAGTVEQVRAGLAFARERGLQVATQATGHFARGLPPLGRTLLLRPRLHPLVEVDPVARVARVRAGAVWGDVVAAVGRLGLAVPHGSSPSVGVIGYLLGGGLSGYGRAHGLAANHVIRFQVVTPDGAVRVVDAEHEPDLFYALRGGGGGYAVVCAVEIRLLPYAEVEAGAMYFPAAAAGDLLSAWHDWAADAPGSITSSFRLLRLPVSPGVPGPLRGVPAVCVDGVALDPFEAFRLERLLRWVATPSFGEFSAMPSAAAVRLRGGPGQPQAVISDSVLLDNLDERGMAAFLEAAGPGSGSPLVAAELRQLGGALAVPPPGAGALGSLEGRLALVGHGVPGAPAPAVAVEAHLDRLLAAARPWATGTRYAGFAERWPSLATCLPDDALKRVTGVRAAYDPGGLLVAPQLPPSPRHPSASGGR